MKKAVIFCAVLFVCLNSLFSAVIQVPVDYGTIQGGIDAAVSGDTVKVEAGTYVENVVMKDGVSLIGAGEEVTIIDGGAAGHVVECSNCSIGVTLQGFTLTNGDLYRGGGMYNDNSTVTVTDCTISNNIATNGGGMTNRDSSATVSNCTFISNTGTNGGGMYNDGGTVVVSNCSFDDNYSKWSGGGIRNGEGATVQITGCRFTNNTVSNTTAGGVHCEIGANVTISNCYFFMNFEMNIYGDYTDGGGNNLGYRVDGDINNPADYRSIQAAINAAADGDNIVVMPGTYVENINMGGKAITLRSSDPEDVEVVAATIIDGGQNGSVITCNSGEGSETIISGFWLTNGSGNNINSFSYGGGMYIVDSSPIVTNCIFDGNTALNAGAMYIENSSPALENCNFSNNTATQSGGGIYIENNSSTTLTECTLINNTADYGGGVRCDNSRLEFTKCNLSENEAKIGGGMYNSLSNSIFNNSSYTNNTAVNGGGIFIYGGSGVFTECSVSFNTSTSSGAGIRNTDVCNIEIIDCNINDNISNEGAGGVYCGDGSSVTLTDNLFYRNHPIDIDGNYIDGGGNSINSFTVDDDQDADFTNIQQAIDVAAEGDIIYVMPGTYYETWIQLISATEWSKTK